MPYYRVCPFCGCNIDPGEKCDCMSNQAATVSAPKSNTAGDNAKKRQKAAENGGTAA